MAIARQIAEVLGIEGEICDHTELKEDKPVELLLIADVVTESLYGRLKPEASADEIHEVVEEVVLLDLLHPAGVEILARTDSSHFLPEAGCGGTFHDLCSPQRRATLLASSVPVSQAVYSRDDDSHRRYANRRLRFVHGTRRLGIRNLYLHLCHRRVCLQRLSESHRLSHAAQNQMVARS